MQQPSPRRTAHPVVEQESNASLAFVFLYLYTLTVLIRPHEFSLETAEYIFIQVFAILTFVFTLLNLRPLKLYPQHYLIIGMLPVVMLSAFFNGWGGGGIEQSERLLVSSVVPFFLFSSLLTSPSRQRKLMFICMVAACAMILNGYVQQGSYNGAFGTGIGNSVSVGRAEMRITYLGIFGDPNDLGMFLVMNMAFAAYFFNTGNFIVKVAMACFFVAIIYGIYITGSRGTIVGAAGLIGLYYFINKAGVKLFIFGVVSAPILATLLSTFGGLTSDDQSADQRLEAWYQGILFLIDNPVLGVSMGNFMDLHGRVAHNSYIHVASELGGLGYSFWGGAIMLNMITGYMLMKKYNTWEQDDIPAPTKQLYKEELLLNKTLFFSMVGFMATAFFISRQWSLLLYIFLGMQTASHIRVMKIRPELFSLFSKVPVYKAMLSGWVLIIAVYMVLKVSL
jgi:O-antigen ligase